MHTDQVRAPSGTDPGEVVAVHFIVDDGVLILTNEEGAAIKEVKEHRLLPSDDPVSLARAFTRERRKLRDPDGFNRPLNYQALGIAWAWGAPAALGRRRGRNRVWSEGSL